MSPSTTNQTSYDDYEVTYYYNIPEELAHELEQEDSYVEVAQTDPPFRSRSARVPKELDSIAEISLENSDPKEVQLWMLLHNMQKI